MALYNRFLPVLVALMSVPLVAEISVAQEAEPDDVINIYYDRDYKGLTTSAKELLQVVAARYNRAGVSFKVVGHSDTEGSAQHSMKLSQDVAEAVVDHMMELGVPSSRIAIAYYGERELAVETKDGVSEPLNRRVEVLVSIRR